MQSRKGSYTNGHEYWSSFCIAVGDGDKRIYADDLSFAFYCLKHVNLDYQESSCNDDADDIADEEGEDEEDENDDEAHLAILR